jgi:periplasmic divalent cation tolerance protein
MDSYVVVLVTTGNKQEAETIVRQLLDKKLIACGNILGPVSSHFHWGEKIESAEEFLVLMKSRLDLFGELCLQVKSLHGYSVPEILALPVIAGDEAYLGWLRSSLR